MSHDIHWEDGYAVGYHCDDDPQDQILVLGDDPMVCEFCGKTLTLHWDVYIIESE